MNHEETGIVEEKGEFTAKLGQGLDQRDWALKISLGTFAVPYLKMSYGGECTFACKT